MISIRAPWNRISTCLPRTALSQRRLHISFIQAARMTNSSINSQQPGQSKPIYFGPFDVTNQVFLTTPHSFALVNLKPLLPGHVLVCPLRPHLRLTDLSPVELTDLFTTVQRVQRMLARQYFAPSSPSSSNPNPSPLASSSPSHPPNLNSAPEQGSFNLALQDGPEAGQTVAHVHVHVIPRIRGSTAKPAETPSDKIYEQMADEEGNVGGALWDSLNRDEKGRPVPGGKFPSIEDADRRARSMAEMEEEAGVYRGVLGVMEAEGC